VTRALGARASALRAKSLPTTESPSGIHPPALFRRRGSRNRERAPNRLIVLTKKCAGLQARTADSARLQVHVWSPTRRPPNRAFNGLRDHCRCSLSEAAVRPLAVHGTGANFGPCDRPRAAVPRGLPRFGRSRPLFAVLRTRSTPTTVGRALRVRRTWPGTHLSYGGTSRFPTRWLGNDAMCVRNGTAKSSFVARRRPRGRYPFSSAAGYRRARALGSAATL